MKSRSVHRRAIRLLTIVCLGAAATVPCVGQAQKGLGGLGVRGAAPGSTAPKGESPGNPGGPVPVAFSWAEPPETDGPLMLYRLAAQHYAAVAGSGGQVAHAAGASFVPLCVPSCTMQLVPNDYILFVGPAGGAPTTTGRYVRIDRPSRFLLRYEDNSGTRTASVLVGLGLGAAAFVGGLWMMGSGLKSGSGGRFLGGLTLTVGSPLLYFIVVGIFSEPDRLHVQPAGAAP